MTRLRERHKGEARVAAPPAPARPVVLATLSVRVDPSAERMAIESALEAGVPLVLVNLIPLPPYPQTLVLAGPEATTLPHEEDLDEVRATARRAADLGVRTQLLRVRTRHPVKALLEVVRHRTVDMQIRKLMLQLWVSDLVEQNPADVAQLVAAERPHFDVR